MKRLQALLMALVAFSAAFVSAEAHAYAAPPKAVPSLSIPVDHYISQVGHQDGPGSRWVTVSPERSHVTRVVCGLIGLAIYAAISVDSPEAAFALATTPVAVPEAVVKSLDELKGNIKRVLKLEADIEKGVEAGKGVAELKEEIQTISTKNAELIDKAKEEAEEAFQKRIDELELEMKSRGRFGGDAVKSYGEQFTEAEAYKTAGDVTAVKGVVVERARKDVTTSPNQNPPNYTGEVVRPQNTRLTMRDLIPVGRSARDVIEYVKLITRADNAAVVAEGALKPESNLAFQDASAKMQVIAHYIPVTKQQLSDHDGLRSTIDSELEYGLQKKEDAKFLYGPGGANDIEGVVPQATVYDKATYGDAVIVAGNDAGTQLIIHVRGAMAQLAVADYAATGLVLNPVDWFKMETSQTGDGAFRFVNPQNRAAPRIWGLDVVDSNQVNATDFVIGDFAMGAQIYDGQLMGTYGIQIETGYINDQFVRNQLSILAEQRVALAVKRPGAFVYYDSDAV